MSDHTPGPWRLIPHGTPDDWWDVIGPDTVVVGEANARAIAAVPELLEALDGLLAEYTDRGNNEVKSNTPESITAMAAIAKARGAL